MIVVKGELLTNALKAKVLINNGYLNEVIRSNNVSVVAFAFGDDGKYWECVHKNTASCSQLTW